MADRPLMLDPVREASGWTLLGMTDDVGFGALGAAWVYDRDAEYWWFLLVSPIVDSKGPVWVYERFTRLFSKWKLPEGITPLEIRIVSPREQLYRDFPVSKENSPGNTATAKFQGITLGVMKVDLMVLYRMKPLDQNTGDRARIFNRKVHDLLAA